MTNKTWIAGYLREAFGSFEVYHFHDTSMLSPMRQRCKIDDNKLLRHDASNLAACLYRIQQTDERIFRFIEATIHSVAPYFKCFCLRPIPTSPENIKLEWEEQDSDMYLDANSLSDGTLRFIALIVLLLQPDAPKVVIIDEPELGLHPAAIIKLAALIHRFAHKRQIIVATQSVEFINQFDVGDIITVDRENGQSVFRRLATDEFTAWLKDYTLGELWIKNMIGGQP